MIYVNHLVLVQGHCLFTVILLGVMLLLRMLAMARKQHDRHGMWIKKPQKLFVASVYIATSTKSQSEMDTLAQFTMLAKSSTTCKAGEARFEVFSQTQRAFTAIPTTQAAL